MELITFVLAAYGLTQILVYGKIFDRWRPQRGRLKKLSTCPMCMGFHVGWFLMLLSPYTELFNFDVTIANFFILGLGVLFLGIGAMMILIVIFKFADRNEI